MEMETPETLLTGHFLRRVVTRFTTQHSGIRSGDEFRKLYFKQYAPEYKDVGEEVMLADANRAWKWYQRGKWPKI